MQLTQYQRVDAFGVALLASAGAAIITDSIQPLVHPVVLPFFFLSVTIAALHGGRGAGLFSVAVSALVLAFWFLTPPGVLAAENRANLGRLITFLAVAIPLAWIAGTVHAQRVRLARQAEENARLRTAAEEAAATAAQALGDAIEASRRAEEEAVKARDAALEAEMSSQEAAEALTREQESERELRTREAELSDFFETASVGLHWVSEDGTIIRVNQAELDMFGYRRDEYLGRKLAEFHVDATIVADMLRRLVAGERINQLRARMRCRDGTVKDVLIDSSGHFQGGKFHHTRCFTRDVTDERRAQENAARLAAIVTSSADAIVGKTLDGTITSWNPAAEQIFGYSAAEMVGDSVFKLIPPELHDLERDVLERLQRGEVVELADSERVRKDGRRIWISLSVSPIRDAAGTIIGAASIKRDITERKLVDERLRDTQRLQAIGQLAGGIAHEANNQMMVVVGASHFLLRRADLSPPARLEVEQILRAADRTASVTRQLLAFSRRQMLQLREVDLNGVVESIAPMLRRALPESQELVLALGGLSGCIRADPRQLEQVLLNLTLNARDAMPQGGRIVIETRDVGRPAEFTTNPPSSNAYHMLAVRDTGHGIEQTTLGRIFEPFFTTKEVGRGTGLGLSVVHGIVSQLGGHIRVESDLGQGTTFELYFPSAQPGIEAPPSSPAEPSPVPEGTVALVVEDDARARAIAVRALTEAGYRVLEAENGRRALEVVGRSGGQVDLVITDIGLPELDGYELVRRLRAERPDLPILMMSGYADEPHRVELGPDIPLLSKPFSPDALVAAAAEVFGRRSAQPPAASGADKPSA